MSEELSSMVSRLEHKEQMPESVFTKGRGYLEKGK
jgi:hypothetical protein